MAFTLPPDLYELAERRATKVVVDWVKRLETQYRMKVPHEEANALIHDIINFYGVMRVSDRIWRLSPERSEDESK